MGFGSLQTECVAVSRDRLHSVSSPSLARPGASGRDHVRFELVDRWLGGHRNVRRPDAATGCATLGCRNPVLEGSRHRAVVDPTDWQSGPVGVVIAGAVGDHRHRVALATHGQLANLAASPYTLIYDLTLLFAGLILMAPTLATTGRYPLARHCVAWQAAIAALYFGPHVSQLIAKSSGLQFFPLLLLGYAIFQARLFWLETQSHSLETGGPPTASTLEPSVATHPAG